MALYGVSLVVTYVAWDTAANAGKTGDVGNHTLRWVKDGVSAAPTNTATEVDATNAPGLYKLTLTATEAQATYGTLAGKSATASVSLMGMSVAFELNAAQVNTEVASALATYDPPTRAELTSDVALLAAFIDTEVAAILVDTAEIGAAGAGLTALGDARIANLNATVSSRATPAQVATELATYDGPTFAELDARTDALDTAVAAVKVDTAAILVDTGTTLDGKVDAIDTVVDAILVDTGTTLDGKLDAIEAQTDDIGVAGAGLTAIPSVVTVTGNVSGNVGGNVTGSVGSVVGAVGSVTGAVGSVTGAVGSVTGAVGSVTAVSAGAITAPSFGAAALDAAAFAPDAVDEFHDDVVEGTTTVRQAWRLILAVLTGKSSGHEAGSPVYRDIGDTKNRIAATTDADGNRTAIGTRDGT